MNKILILGLLLAGCAHIQMPRKSIDKCFNYCEKIDHELEQIEMEYGDFAVYCTCSDKTRFKVMSIW